MPKKVTYIQENMHVSPFRVLWNFIRAVDFRQPLVVVGRTDKGELYVASTDSGQTTNSLLTKAIRFIKIG